MTARCASSCSRRSRPGFNATWRTHAVCAVLHKILRRQFWLTLSAQNPILCWRAFAGFPMSRVSRELCLPVCLAIGVALYVYSALLVPRGETKVETVNREIPSAGLQDKPQLPPLLPLKPRTSSGPNTDLTGSIGPELKPRTGPQLKPPSGPQPKPQVAADQLPKVPGIRVASLPAHTVVTRPPDTTRWSPAVLYYPAVIPPKHMSANRQMFPPTARRMRVVRAGRAYRRHTSFRFVIGVGPRW